MIRLRTLGQLTLEQEGGTSGAALLSQPKRLALLVYLAAVHPPAPRSRDTLIALLWPEQGEAHARTGLRQALVGLRRTLGTRSLTGMGEERVGVDPAHLWCDASAFTAAIRRGDRVEALALYGGPFLDGFHVADAPEFERWVERERRRLELDAIAAAWQLADEAESEGDGTGARRWAERAIELAAYDEVGFRRYLGMLDRQADGATAITAYAAYERRLAEDLGLEPSAETTALIERIRTRVAPRVLPAHVRSARPADAPSAPAKPQSSHRQLPNWRRWAVGVVAVVSLSGALAAARWWGTDASVTRFPRTTIAVLPFRSLSTDSSDAYFAAGFQDELMTQLAKVSSLRLVGRTSVSSYQQKSKPLRQIGEELGAGAIVEASVQIVDNRFRIVVHLLDPLTEEDLWMERYERTLDDAFAVQAEIAQRIVAAVGVTLTGAEAGALKTAPTDNAEAYQLYLQGLEYSRRPALKPENDRAAQQLFEQALALDSTFAPAHSELALVHWRTWDLGYDRTPARLAQSRREAATALSLAPGLPHAHLVIGLARHFSTGDFRRALAEFNAGLRAAPNDAQLLGAIGAMHMHLGNWDSAAVAYEQARRLEPRDANLAFIVGETRHYRHRYDEAIAAYRRAAELAPDFTQARLSLSWSYILWKGQLDTLRAVLRALPQDGEPGAGGGSLWSQRLLLLKMERKPDSLLSLLRTHGGSMDPLDRAMTTAEAHLLRADTTAARVMYDSALVVIEARLRAAPDDEGLRSARAAVLGGLGRRADAVRDIRWIERANAKEKSRWADGWTGVGRLFAIAGETDAALPEIERLLARPSGLTVPFLRLDPAFDGIRSDPRFQRLLVKYADPPRF